MSIGFRPRRSPSTPQIGLAIATQRPATLPAAAVHRSSSRPAGTLRSWWMKIERKGKAKLKPKMAMNSANHRAARLRRQSTPGFPPEPTGGWVPGGGAGVSVARAEDLDDPIGCDRQVVHDRARVALSKGVLDRVRDRRRNRGGRCRVWSL